MKFLPFLGAILLVILFIPPAMADDVDGYIADLKDQNSSVRIDAVNALGWFAKNDTRVVDPLIEALNDPDWGVRTMASISLSLSRDPRAVEPVIQALKDENSSVRYNAAVSFGLGLNDPRAVNPLIQLLQDEDSSVRWAAATSLGELNDTRAVDPLIQALKDEDLSVQKVAAAALEKLGWQEDAEQAFVEPGNDSSGNFSSSHAKMTAGVSRPLGSETNITGPKEPAPGSIIAEGEVGTTGGQVESPDGLTVEFPEGALSSDESITIKRAEDAPPNSSFYFIERQGSGLLNKSANVTLPLPQGTRPDEAFVMQEISGDIWVVLPSKYDAASGKLTAQVSHFSGIGAVDPNGLDLGGKDYAIEPNTLIIKNDWGWNPIKLAYMAIESTKDVYRTAGVDQSIEVMAGPEAIFQVWWAASGGNAVKDKDDVITAIFDKNTGEKINVVRGRVESQSFITEIGEKPPERTYVPVPRSILMLADELTMARNFYKSAGYNVPEAIPVRVFQLDKPDVAGYWDPVRKYLDINVEFMVSNPEKNRSRLATIAHEYWHAICTKNGYVNSKMPWVEEAFGVAWESEVFPGCNDYVEIWHPWSTVGKVLGSGFLNSRTEEDPVGNRGDETKRGYDLWPWAKFLIHKQTLEDIIDISSGKMDSGVLRELFVQFTHSLLVKEEALDDPAIQEPAMSNPPREVSTGWSRKNLALISQRDYLYLGLAKLPDWLSSSRSLSFNLLKVKNVPLEKPLAKGELQPPAIVVRRKSIDPTEQIIALSPSWPKMTRGGQLDNINALRSIDDLIIGDGSIVIPARWLYEKAQQKGNLVLDTSGVSEEVRFEKEGNVTLPIALVGTSMDSGKASPLLIYRLQPPTDIQIANKGDKMVLTWKLPDLGENLKPSDCLAGYRLFIRTKNGEEKMIPDQLIAPDKTSFEVSKSMLSDYTALGLASQDAVITDEETGQAELSETFWCYSGVWVLSNIEEIPVSKASFEGFFDSEEGTSDDVIHLFGGLSFCMREQTLSVSRNSISSRLRWDNLCIPKSDRPYEVRDDWNCSISSTNTWTELPSMLTPDTLLNITLAFKIEGPCVKDYSWADFNWIPRVDTKMSVNGYDSYYPGIDLNKFPDSSSIEAPKPLKVESYKVPEGKEGAQLFIEIIGDGVSGEGGYNYTYTYHVSPGPKRSNAGAIVY